MISKTQLKTRMKRKTDPSLAMAIKLARDQKEWNGLAKRLSGPTRELVSINLSELDARMKEGDTVIVPGKVLGIGMLNKKGVVYALKFSASAKEKLQKAKCTIGMIADEIKRNPKATGVKIL